MNITRNEIDGDISKALRTLYGFNLGFAIEGDVEKNIKSICDNVVNALCHPGDNTSKEEIQERVTLSLTEKSLLDISKAYSEYKDAVMRRLENSGTFSEL